MARPTKFSKERTRKIVSALAVGNTRTTAAALARIDADTLRRWELSNAGFADAIKEAEAEAEANAVSVIREASFKTWQAAAWLLERRNPKEWGRNRDLSSGGDEVRTVFGKQDLSELSDEELLAGLSEALRNGKTGQPR